MASDPTPLVAMISMIFVISQVISVPPTRSAKPRDAPRACFPKLTREAVNSALGRPRIAFSRRHLVDAIFQLVWLNYPLPTQIILVPIKPVAN